MMNFYCFITFVTLTVIAVIITKRDKASQSDSSVANANSTTAIILSKERGIKLKHETVTMWKRQEPAKD